MTTDLHITARAAGSRQAMLNIPDAYFTNKLKGHKAAIEYDKARAERGLEQAKAHIAAR